MTGAKSFKDFFSEELLEALLPLESQRKKISSLGIRSYILTGVLIITALIAFSARSGIAGLIAMALLAPVLIMWMIFYQRKKEYVPLFKENIVRRIIQFIDPGLTYDHKSHIHRKDYDKSGLFLQKPERYTGDDYVEGKREKTFFAFSELHTEYEVQSGKSSRWVTIFKGLFFIGDFNKHFQGRTYAWSEANPQLNFFNKLFSGFASGLGKVKLEDPEFEGKFIVYSNDQVEARYILTPSLMERMVKLQEMMGEELSFSFVDTNVYAAVPVRDELFEPSVFSANDYQKLGDYYNTIHIVFDIIDELNLNLRIWTKD